MLRLLPRLLCVGIGALALHGLTAVADEFTAFEQAVPGTGQSIAMVPVRGGRFTMGSSADEVGRSEAEGPQHEVVVADFWMGQYEISWQQYEVFIQADQHTAPLAAGDKLAALAIDGVTGATVPYVDLSFGMGKEGYPAVNMTQYAALMYARWLSATTGRFYRLPTEAEWEYACRAATITPWSFGADAVAAADYAVYRDNSDGAYAKIGSRKANAWQLYDMHGNVAEWTMDQYDPAFYAKSAADQPWNPPKTLYPRVARGGSWMDEVTALRCAARLPSAAEWKARDPQLPKSLWWLTNAPFIGFRLVSPKQQPTAEQIEQYWPEAIEDYGD